MSAGSCVLSTTARKAGEKVFRHLSTVEENGENKLLSVFGLTKEDIENNTIAYQLALDAAVKPIQIEAGIVEGKARDLILDSPEKLARSLERWMTIETDNSVTHTMLQGAYETALKKVREYYGEQNLDTKHPDVRVLGLSPDSNETLEDVVGELKKNFQECSNVVSIEEKNGAAYLYIKKPVLHAEDAQAAAIEKLNQSQEAILIEYTDSYGNKVRISPNEKLDAEGFWKKSGIFLKSKGTAVKTVSVTKDGIEYDSSVEFPFLASPTGNIVDSFARAYFDKNSYLWNEDGTFNETGIEQFLDETSIGGFYGMLSKQGVMNLKKDFDALNAQLQATWPDCKILSNEYTLVSQKADGTWLEGKPDLIVVDKAGTLHIIDVKTSIASTNSENYGQGINAPTKSTQKTKYSMQVSRYIGMLQSLGFNVDTTPRILLVDTFYDSTDLAKKNTVYSSVLNGEYRIQQDNRSLRQYAEEEGTSFEKLIAGEDLPLWVEPRLHMAMNVDPKTGRITFSGEIDALQELDKDIALAFKENQEDLLSTEAWFAYTEFAGAPVFQNTRRGIIKRSSESLLGQPELIGETECQELADMLMARVSSMISDIQRRADSWGITFPNAADGKLVGKPRHYIIKECGLENLINEAFEGIKMYAGDFYTSIEDWKEKLNSEDFWDMFDIEDEKDFYAKKILNAKANHLVKYKDELIRMGRRKLQSLESCVVSPKTLHSSPNYMDLIIVDPENVDTGNTEAIDEAVETYNEGLSDLEAWMMDLLNFSPRATLSQKVRRLLESLYDYNDTGEIIEDAAGFGYGKYLNSTEATAVLMEYLTNCETWEEMEDVLTKLPSKSKRYTWANRLLEILNSDINLKAQFFRNFRRDADVFTVVELVPNSKTGIPEVKTRIINKKSAAEVLKHKISSAFYMGFVGEYKGGHLIEKNKKGENTLVTETANQLEKDADRLCQNIAHIYETIQPKYAHEKAFEKVVEGGHIKALTELLHGVGIAIPEEVILEVCASKTKGGHSNLAYRLSNAVIQIVRAVKKPRVLEKAAGRLPNEAYKLYADLIDVIAPKVQQSVESGAYHNGKTYYSYSNPSKLKGIIRNLRGDRGIDAVRDYVEKNYGRYHGWFKSTDGKEWLNDFIGDLEDHGDSVLKHKVELSYCGNPYQDLGALSFQMSILANYLPSSEDELEGHVNSRWFAVPTMSNKQTNEFIRMRPYHGRDAIVERVLRPTLVQEMNRIADVLHHYAHFKTATDQIDIYDPIKRKDKFVAYYTAKLQKEESFTKAEATKLAKAEAEVLKLRIKTKSITATDLQHLTHITSGAKFHFLWYLNNDTTANTATEVSEENGTITAAKGFAEELATMINDLLLTEEERADNPQALTTNAKKDIMDRMQERIEARMEEVVQAEMESFERIGLFEKETVKEGNKTVTRLKYLTKLGEEKWGHTEERFRENLTDFIWEDIAANINIIQMTAGDLAFFGNAVNYQKRIAQLHSPGQRYMHQDGIDDGYLRSVYLSDYVTKASDTSAAASAALQANRKNIPEGKRAEYDAMVKLVLSGLQAINATDGQSLNCISSIKKKLTLQGEWDDTLEKAYNAIRSGNFNIEDLGVLMQPRKPFATADIPKFAGSTTMLLRKTPVQHKNSEYLMVLASALSQKAGVRDRMAAINDFMEETHKKHGLDKGIDTAHFVSVGKIGVSGVIDIEAFDKWFDNEHTSVELKGNENTKEEAYNRLLKEYMLEHISKDKETPLMDQVLGIDDTRKSNIDIQDQLEEGLSDEENYWDNTYVDTIPLSSYSLQQEVPAHDLEHEQLYGSQIRILGISDITPGTKFQVREEEMSDKELVDEYFELHATNIKESYHELLKELGLGSIIDEDGNISREKLKEIVENPKDPTAWNNIQKKLESILVSEIIKDAKYSDELAMACSLKVDETGRYNFAVPLFDMIQSRKIQELINSIIKKRLNRQRIRGGSFVQATAYDKDLHIRYKDARGNILKTRQEYKGTDEEYKKYIAENQNGIAYFECYMSIPNAEFERLLTKEDGSLMSYAEAEEYFNAKDAPESRKRTWKDFTEVIGYRIPTEDKYSMLPLKIVGFLPKAAGQAIMMPQEITDLTGSDFDIDKMYVICKTFYDNIGRGHNAKIIEEQYDVKPKEGMDRLEKLRYQVVTNAKAGKSLTEGLNKEEVFAVKEFIDEYRLALLEDLKAFRKPDMRAEEAQDRRNARNNRLVDLQWAVLTNQDTMVKMLNPGNFNEQKQVGRMIRLAKGKSDATVEDWNTWSKLANEEGLSSLDDLLESGDIHSTTLPSSKIYFQQQNMQGTQMVGIFANNNVSHAFCSFQKIGIDLGKRAFKFNGVLIGDVTTEDGILVLDRQRGFNGQYISKTIASFLAAAVDTAKDPVLADMNVNTFTGGVAMVLARLGFSTAEIGAFLAQPIIEELSQLYFQNKADGIFGGAAAINTLAGNLRGKDEENFLYDLGELQGTGSDVLSFENLVKNLSQSDYKNSEDALQYQKSVLKAFNVLYAMASDLSDLTFCTKFNSVTNAVGPTIGDTEEDVNRVETFRSRVLNGETCFYDPTGIHSSTFDSPADVIDNNPILSAFYNNSEGLSGASNIIFSLSFPHYYPGFQMVYKKFQNYYTRGGKLPAAVYNKLINDYVYFLLTMQTDEAAPVLPTSPEELNYLIKDITKRYSYILDMWEHKKGNTGRNALLDQDIRKTPLEIRGKTADLNMETLFIRNSMLNVDSQDELRRAWADLINMNNPNLSQQENQQIRNFGVELFFYTLARGGFNFSPKTLMHMAPIAVRYMATYKGEGYSNYIDGLNNLRSLDAQVENDFNETLMDRFINQFIRNNSDNTTIVPRISANSTSFVLFPNGDASFDLKKYSKDKYKIVHNNTAAPYIHLISNVNGKRITWLYRLKDTFVSSDFKQTLQEVVYERVTRLGVRNEFVEYNANDDIETSFYNSVWLGKDTNSTEDNSLPKLPNASEDGDAGDSSSEESKWIPMWRALRPLMESDSDYSTKNLDLRRKFKAAYFKDAEEGSLLQEFQNTMDNLLAASTENNESQKNDLYNHLKEMLENQNSCFF